ncbi:hypothetical protein IMZ48_21820 [Candidatus Bathyarchaeota archaeon]|nr:hypothetical protein [Candidatus Bathyarchaeota archaeon]
MGTPFARQANRRRTSQVALPDRDIRPWDESTPLLTSAHRTTHAESGAPGLDTRRGTSPASVARSKSPFNVNYPPSMPTTPTLGPTTVGLDMSFGDVLIRDKLARDESPSRLSLDERQGDSRHSSPSPTARRGSTGSARSGERPRYAPAALSEVAEEAEEAASISTAGRSRRRRRRRTPWPDLEVLEAWKSYEQEQETSRRVKRITEPQLINGRLRAVHKGWYRSDDDMPFRFTYFNEDLQSTIHSQTISGLIQGEGSFRELFVPEPRVLSDDDSEEDEEMGEEDLNPFTARVRRSSRSPPNGGSRTPFGPPPLHPLGMGLQGNSEAGLSASRAASRGRASPAVSQFDGLGRGPSPAPFSKMGQETSNERRGTLSPKQGDRPVWWLDVFAPTEAEMKVISQAFGIHPLTAEDIMVQEAREKVELFHSYYFLNYRTFDQDPESGAYMDPVNMYSVVFREGIITFHFSMTPHPANVRRRIRQLKDYLIVSSDWISYAIVDDITDVFGPIIQGVEEEVDDIDEAIMSSWGNDKKKDGRDDEKGGDDEKVPDLSRGDVLRRVGDCRKRVMSLYRLLGNKADVIKGFAKRCNERYTVTPHSDIGLYLGDIQDHIVTMTSNLSHYEK